tara:strand:- start:82 stop:564 length:483 start_codon:yes stop_codon:yes gene_type:complete
MTTIPIENFEHYIIFEDGLIINSKPSKDESHIIKPSLTEHGYRRLALSWEGQQKKFYLHRLLALTFIPNPFNYIEVDHIDRNRENNSLDNLRWCTKLENNDNRGMPLTNTSGVLGVSQSRTGWVYCRIRNGIKHIKYFRTKIEAIIYKKNYLDERGLEYI